MTPRLVAMLLAVAVRRWPAALRDDLRREWSAELHVLAAQGRQGRMLRYAASLAVARPARRSTPAGVLLAGAWRIARLVLVAPLIALGLVAVSFVAMNVIVALLSAAPFAMDLQLPLATLFTLLSAVLLARLGRRWALPGPSAAVVPALAVPGFAVSVLVTAAYGSSDKVAVHAPAHAIFFLGLGGALVAVARPAAAGRRRRAWWTGVAGAIVAADVAVMLPVLGAEAPPDETPHLASAPVWLFTSLTDSGFGLPSPTGMQIFLISDVVELDPFFYVAFAALALGAAIAGARPVPVPPEPLAAPDGPAAPEPSNGS